LRKNCPVFNSIMSSAEQDVPRNEELDDLVFDVGLGAIASSSAGQFRFNQDGVYTARETAVLARCTVVERVHGQLSEEDPTPCSLLVFDFDFDRLKKTRAIHEVTVTLVLNGVKVHSLAPKRKILFDPQEAKKNHTQGWGAEGGVEEKLKLGLNYNDETARELDETHYSSAKGWTTHFPRRRPNDPAPHNCVKWYIEESTADRDVKWVPPYFRSAVLLEREPEQTEFTVEMEIDAKADFLTEITDAVLLRGNVPKGRLRLDTAQSTSVLYSYPTLPEEAGGTKLLGGFDLQAFGKLSLGQLQKERFSLES
jgi:hypothetical protein